MGSAFSHKRSNEWLCHSVSGELKPNQGIPHFLDHVITCDKSWVHYCDPKSKQESSHWKSTQFSTKEEGTPAEIGGEGVHGGFFFDSRGPIINMQFSGVRYCNSCIGIFEWRGQSWSISEFYATIMLDHTLPKSWKLGWAASKLISASFSVISTVHVRTFADLPHCPLNEIYLLLDWWMIYSIEHYSES